jgi:hypothetical protein
MKPIPKCDLVDRYVEKVNGINPEDVEKRSESAPVQKRNKSSKKKAN